jgi:hypothetical protein
MRKHEGKTNSERHYSTRIGFGPHEAAAMLGISPVSLDRLVARGLLRPSRALRRPLFTERELLRFLEETR